MLHPRLSAALILGALLVAASCAPPVPLSAPTPSSIATQQPTARRGGTLVVAITSDPGQLNGGITTAGGTHAVVDNIFNGLVRLDEQFNPEPDLAESWTIAPDARTYTFKLRSGVVWQDGQPFSSDDVKFTFDEILLKYQSDTRAGLLPLLDGIDAPDPRTVVFRFKQPYGALLSRLPVNNAPILPKHVYAGTDPQTNPANTQPIGTGPFKLAEYLKGDIVRLVRNDHYFKSGLPYLDEVDFKVIPDPTTSDLALEHGEVDYVTQLNPPDVARFKSTPGITVVYEPTTLAGNGNCEYTMPINQKHPPFDQLAVRQALTYAIDRQQMVDQGEFGLGKPATSPITSALAWAYNPNVQQYPHDPAKAQQLLDQAGLARGAGGTRFKVVFPVPAFLQRDADIVRQNLVQIGLDVDLQVMEFNAALDRVFVRSDFDISAWGNCNGADPSIGIAALYTSDNIKPIPFANVAGYSNPEIDTLIARASTSLDRSERAKLYAQVQDTLTRDLPYIWLIENTYVRAFNTSFHDLAYWTGRIAEQAWTDKGS